MMNRRSFVSLAIAASAVGFSPNGRTNSPVARLVNNDKGMWYNGRADKGNACEGDDLLLYPLEEGANQKQIASWNEQIAALVKDGHAEYL